jgi:hypothetical protein
MQGRLRTATPVRVALTLAFTIAALVAAAPAAAQLSPPFNGNPISPGLGPTYGEAWCAPTTGESVNGLQGSPLALIPYAAVGCTLDKIQAEADTAGVPRRMTVEVIGHSAVGNRPIYGVVVNALETPEQQRDFERWQQLRAIMLDDPAAAQALLEDWGADVKMPVIIQGNIHGDEREGLDAMMQVLRDLVTLPRGTNAAVDKFLDHGILAVIPTINPDGRVAGTRANGNNFDMNRDWIVQSQPEVRASVRFQQEWLAPVGLDLHGYVNPTLIDGLTKPHNPGLEYDIFLNWNQRRLDANQAALSAVGMGITRPVNQWNASGGGTSGNPSIAEGWDDWGPFYTQTYMAMYGVDSSTLEMCSGGTGCNGRFGSKRAQYVGFWSSADWWIDRRNAALRDQLEIFRRGVTGADRPLCCADPLIASRNFTESQHNWMVPYPKAFVIPQNGGGQRSNAEANRMVKWLLDNGIKVTRATEDFTWNETTYPAGSYVVWMNQALRGLALTVLSAGQDISTRITQLYAPPGAWSHGLLWGADVVEIPRGDASFDPATTQIGDPNELVGGVRGGTGVPADWYSATFRGVRDIHALYGLLRDGVQAELAEAPFDSTTGGRMSAGTLIFGNDPATVAAIDAAGKAAGVWFERNVGVAKPATTKVAKAPRVAILGSAATAPRNDTEQSLRAIFGESAEFLSLTTGTNSIQNAAVDPLLGFDVIYNTGQGYPTNATSRARLNAFFARGGGYIATGQSTTGYTFLTGAVPALVSGSWTQGSSSAGGGITNWINIGGENSPLTGVFPGSDYLYMPTNVTYYSAVPTGAVIDGRHNPSMVGSSTNGPSPGFIAGLWRSRASATNNAPVIVRGQTNVTSRYSGLATNPFSRQDAEREWLLIGQAALWSVLNDEADSSIGFPADGEPYNESRFDAGCADGAGICGTAAGGPGRPIAKVQVAVQQEETGLWWDGTGFASDDPVYADATGTDTWSFSLPAVQLPADGDYLVRSKAIDSAGNEQVQADAATFTYDTIAPEIEVASPAGGGSYVLRQSVDADYECTDERSGVASCDGPVADGSPFDTSSLGGKSFTVDASDEAGNESSRTVLYEVTTWPFGGFGPPVAAFPTVNSAKAGSAVPVKFRLGGFYGLDVIAAGFPISIKVNCTTFAPLEMGVPTTSGDGLQFANGQYSYVWKTDKAWGGTCRDLVVHLIDGTTHRARYKFN